MPEVIKENIYSFNISITNITNSSDEEISEYFRYLQKSRETQSWRKINSLPGSSLEKYLNRINNKEKFFRILTFTNERKQFDRVFYSILGLLDGKIGFVCIRQSRVKICIRL